MAAVVRIKRRLDEDPLESLVLNCKRKKNDANKPEDLSAVLKLAGTSQKEENIEAILRKHRAGDAAELKEQFKKHPVNINDKIRADLKETSKNNRYKIVNCFRKTLNSQDSDEPQASCSSASEVTVFDVETDHNSNEAATISQEADETSLRYVYDFYYTNSDDFGEADIAEYVSVYPLNDPLVFGSIRDNGLLDNDSDDASEDSNAENYWKNDYPDEDDLESINEDDMIEAVKNLKIDEDLLSSDSGEENLVYSRDEEDFQDRAADVDKEDELRFGQKYAIFKAKNKNVETTGLANDFYYGDIDEEEYYY